MGYKRFFGNVGYSRFWEYSLFSNELNLNEILKHLDIGSGKYGEFPLFLEYKTKANIYATDILDYTESQIPYIKKLGIYPLLDKKYFVKKIDARKMQFDKESFDSISFVSTIEHIPDNGDSLAVKESNRILKNGGKLIISVPFTPKKFREDYKDDEVYERKEKGKKLFFQRVYDLNSIHERLIKPSGLKLEKLEFYGEKYFSIYKFWHKTPLFLNLPFRIFMPLFSIFFIRKIKEEELNKLSDKNYYFAYISLKKE